jgi:hypothetical protein
VLMSDVGLGSFMSDHHTQQVWDVRLRRMMAGQGGGHHLCLPRTQRAIEYEVKSFSAMSNQPGINTTPAPI